MAAFHCAVKADVFSLGCVAIELLLDPDNFRVMWLSAYDKANVVSKSFAEANPDINAEFVVEIKTAIESVGLMFQEQGSDIIIDEESHNSLMKILSFHPGCRPSLDALRETEWIDCADEAAAYRLISEVINGKRLEQRGSTKDTYEGVDSSKRSYSPQESLSPPGSASSTSSAVRRIRRDTPIPLSRAEEEGTRSPLSSLTTNFNTTSRPVSLHSESRPVSPVTRAACPSVQISPRQEKTEMVLSYCSKQLRPVPIACNGKEKQIKRRRHPPELLKSVPGRKTPISALRSIVTVQIDGGSMQHGGLLLSPVVSPQTSPRRLEDAEGIIRIF